MLMKYLAQCLACNSCPRSSDYYLFVGHVLSGSGDEGFGDGQVCHPPTYPPHVAEQAQHHVGLVASFPALKLWSAVHCAPGESQTLLPDAMPHSEAWGSLSASPPDAQLCPPAWTCCRKGDPFQGPKLGSCVTLGNKLPGETHVLTKQDILLGRAPAWRAGG